MTRKRLIAVAAGLASLGGLAGLASLGGGGSSQAILNPVDYVHCYTSGQGGAVTTGLISKTQNTALRHTYCGVYYVAGV